MSGSSAVRIAIVGGGFSGAMTAVQLIRQAGNKPLELFLIEKTGTIGLGVAYSTTDPLHLLNVMAGRMSAFPDEPEHFINWIKDRSEPFGATDYVPRSLYGQYIRDVYQKAIAVLPANIQLTVIADEAVGLRPLDKGLRLYFRDALSLTVDKALLALGNYPPAHPLRQEEGYTHSPRYAQDPWTPGLMEPLSPDDPVVLIGSGLTMVDMIMTLHRNGHRGRIYSVSTHGYLPVEHQLVTPYTGITDEVARCGSVRDWLKYIRSHIRKAEAQGIDWRAVIDAFRPYSQAFWLNLPLIRKKRFIQHLRHIWGVSRHRMPNKTAAIMQQLLDSGQLQVIAARVRKIEVQQDRLQLTIERRATGERETISGSLVVNCTGPESNYYRVPSDLVAELLQEGLIQADDMAMGMAALPNGTLLDAQGQASGELFTMGPPLKGILWESVAVPELRVQAKEMAKLLLG